MGDAELENKAAAKNPQAEQSLVSWNAQDWKVLKGKSGDADLGRFFASNEVSNKVFFSGDAGHGDQFAYLTNQEQFKTNLQAKAELQPTYKRPLSTRVELT